MKRSIGDLIPDSATALSKERHRQDFHDLTYSRSGRMKIDLCVYSGYKIYPGHGRTLVSAPAPSEAWPSLAQPTF